MRKKTVKKMLSIVITAAMVGTTYVPVAAEGTTESQVTTTEDGSNQSTDQNKGTVDETPAADKATKDTGTANSTESDTALQSDDTQEETTEVAEVGSQKYETLQGAIDAAENATVKLLKDVTTSVTVKADQTVTLDLNGHKLTNEGKKDTIVNNGTLTIEDSAANGTVDNISHGKAAVKNMYGGTATLTGGTYTRSQEKGSSGNNSGGNSYYTLQNLGTMTIKDGVNVNQGANGQGKFSSLVINGDVKGQLATMTIEGGTFTGGLNSVKNGEAGNLTITGGTFTNTAQYAVLNWETTTITGGTFAVSKEAESVMCNGSYDGSAGTIEVTGGTFTAAANVPIIEEFAGYGAGTTTKVSGGSFSTAIPGKYCETGYVSVEKDGTYGVEANENVAEVLGKQYKRLQDAIDKADDKAVVKLLANTTASITVKAGKNVTLDLNGCVLTNEAGKHTITNEGTLTIEDTEVNKVGTVDNISHQKATVVNKLGGTVILRGGTYTRSQENGGSKENSGGNSYYTLQNRGTMTIEDGVNVNQGSNGKGTYSSLVVNGDADKKDEASTLTINGGNFTGGLNSVKNGSFGTLTINGGSFKNTAQYAILNWETTTITGGSFKVSNKAEGVMCNGSYAESAGTIEVKGGTFTAAANVPIIEEFAGYGAGTTTKVSGGSFSTAIPGKYCEKGYVPVANNGTYGVEANENVAEVSDKQYKTLQDAIDEAGDEAVVKLLANTTASITVEAGKNVTLDLNGCVLTNEAGKHTITNGGTLTIEDTEVNKVGTVDNISHQKAAVLNKLGGTVTLTGGTYTRSQEKGSSGNNSGGNSYYTLQNLGTMTIKDGVNVNQGANGQGKFSSLVINGDVKGQLATMTIEGGTFTGGLNSVKNGEAGNLTITGGTFTNTAQYAVLNWETTTITGGTFAVSKEAESVMCNGSYDGSAGTIEVKGGTFTAGENVPIIEEFAGYGAGTTTKVFGGEFSSEIPEKYCADGYVPTKNENGTYGVETVTIAVIAGDQETIYNSLEDAVKAATEGSTIQLRSNVITEEVIKVSEKNITFDLNGHIWTAKKQALIITGGSVVVQDSTAINPTVNGATVSGYKGGKISAKGTTVSVYDTGNFTIESGMIESTGYVGVWVEKSNAVMKGGYILSQEFGIGVVKEGATLTVSGGVIEAKDNAAVAGNGTKDYGGTTININGGNLVGHIKSEKYIACGIYHPQAGTLNITGGEIYADKGVGILMRAGKMNMTGGNVTASGNTSGWIGDSKVISNCYGIYVDGSANYPGAKEGGLGVEITSGAVKADKDVPALNLSDATTSDVKAQISVKASDNGTAPTFSSTIDESYCENNGQAEGYYPVATEDGNYTVDNTISTKFLGGSLRKDSDDYTQTSMRFGYTLTIPKNVQATWKWNYGLNQNKLNGSVEGKKFTEDNGHKVSNLVVTEIPKGYYSKTIYSQLVVTYVTESNETYTYTDSIKARSVKEVAEAILGDGQETTTSKNYATAILEQIK